VERGTIQAWITVYSPEYQIPAFPVEGVTDGKIRAFKIGGRGLIRFHDEDLQAFIDEARKKNE
jgi:hypothetical protein